ncbi:MAG: hypothetical protein IJ901_06505 [Bacteroidaceae bacterium]|nr:hypothetical protein [Bacteroidaceae bacterium]
MTQNGITFNSVKVGAYPQNGTPVFSLVGQQGPDEDGGIINVVDIDWNGAQLSLPGELNLGATITINTTGQLLNAIRFAYNHNN